MVLVHAIAIGTVRNTRTVENGSTFANENPAIQRYGKAISIVYKIEEILLISSFFCVLLACTTLIVSKAIGSVSIGRISIIVSLISFRATKIIK